LGKGVKTSFNFEYSAEGQTATCANDCVSSFEGMLGGKWEVEVLTEKVEAAINGHFHVESNRCQLCDPQTCQESCGERYCLSSGGGGGASLAYTRKIPLFPPKSFSWGPVQGRIGCELSGTVGLGLDGSVSRDWPGEAMACENCEDCTTFSATVTGSIGGALECTLVISASAASASGLVVGSVSVVPELTFSNATGEGCENPGFCSHAKVTAMASAAGVICANLRFFQAKADCKFSYSASAEAGCEGFNNMVDGPTYECSVSAHQEM
jgi:hypothetical protein